MKKVVVTASILLVVVVVYKVYMGLLQGGYKLKVTVGYTWLQLKLQLKVLILWAVTHGYS